MQVHEEIICLVSWTLDFWSYISWLVLFVRMLSTYSTHIDK